MNDFWWMTQEEEQKYIYVELVHHEPLKEEGDPAYSSFCNPYFAHISEIQQWRANHQNQNVYRSLKIWADKNKSDTLLVPFLVDVDNECGDLDDALTVTRETVKYICKSIRDSDIRVFFTGHKGFNIEILPCAIGIVGTLKVQENKAECVRKEIIRELQQGKNNISTVNIVSERGTLIDRIHHYVRLHGSINKWIENGTEKARKKIELTVNEVNNLSLCQILDRSIA